MALGEAALVDFARMKLIKNSLVPNSLQIELSGDTDIKKAKEIITTILKNNPKVLLMPAAEVSVKNLTDNSIQLAVRPWANNDDFGAVFSDTLENCKLAFDAAEITFQPYITEVSKSNKQK